MSWVTVAVGVGTAAYGVYQSQSAKKEAKKEKARADIEGKATQAEIDASMKERMGRVRQREMTSMPGQELMEQKIGASTASGLTAYKEMGNQANFQNMIQQSIRQQNQQYADIGIKAAQYKLDRSLDVDEALMDKAGMTARRQAMEQQRSDAEMARLRERQQAGEQNIAGGAQLGAQGAFGAAGSGGEGGRVKGEGAARRKEKRELKGFRNAEDEYGKQYLGQGYGS